MGGEHQFCRHSERILNGSSPRGRGTQRFFRAVVNCKRIIPAWAGNTSPDCVASNDTTDHPRVGGEHFLIMLFMLCISGSSPRGRGTRADVWGVCCMGRIIPAWAGNTRSSRSEQLMQTDHPRVGGEHSETKLPVPKVCGSSPRGRGTHGRAAAEHAENRIIPAWAGNTPAQPFQQVRQPDHPRVGGEHSKAVSSKIVDYGSSPRGRGTLTERLIRQKIGRIIPAWAGNTSPGAKRGVLVTDHPRVGGEHGWGLITRRVCDGSSPRGRGTLFL